MPLRSYMPATVTMLGRMTAGNALAGCAAALQSPSATSPQPPLSTANRGVPIVPLRTTASFAADMPRAAIDAATASLTATTQSPTPITVALF